MSSQSKITRITIPADKIEPFVFFGIVTSEPDYTISLRINKKAGISLRHSEEEVTLYRGAETITFQKFTTADNRYALVANKSGKHFLLSKLGKIDFLFTCSPGSRMNRDEIAAVLRSVEGITAVFVIDSSVLKDKNVEMIRPITE